MSIKKIDELTRLTLANALIDLESLVIPVKEDQSVNEADGAMIAQLIPVTYDSAVAYIAERRIEFEFQLFRVLSDAAVGETPNTDRSKFKYLGGGINAANTVTGSNPSGFNLTATIDTNSGLIVFSGLNPASFGDMFTITISNSTILANTDVECYITNCSDGHGAVVNKVITNGSIFLVVENLNNQGDNLFEFSLWFNNKA